MRAQHRAVRDYGCSSRFADPRNHGGDINVTDHFPSFKGLFTLTMKKSISVIPHAPLARIIADQGARASADGVKEFAQVLIEFADKISKRAISVAENSGRKTVTDADIKLAAKQV